MDDKLVMTDILNTSKSICNLLNQGAVESNDVEICNTYKKVLQAFLTMQHDIYKTMQDQGWYPVEDVKSQNVKKVKNKFDCNELKS